jgi:hypothetical protein
MDAPTIVAGSFKNALAVKVLERLVERVVQVVLDLRRNVADLRGVGEAGFPPPVGAPGTETGFGISSTGARHTRLGWSGRGVP